MTDDRTRYLTGPLRRLRDQAPLDAIYKARSFGAWSWPPWARRKDLSDAFEALWEYVLADTEATTEALQLIGETMTSNEEAAYARAGEVVALLKAEFASLRSQVDAAVADKDAAVAAGVASALNEDSARDAERVEGLLGELESVLPAQAEVPEVEVPEPGQAAELPADSESDQDSGEQG